MVQRLPASPRVRISKSLAARRCRKCTFAQQFSIRKRAFASIISYDFSQCLGNHEFDDNIDGLIPFLNDAEFPVLAANLDLRREPELAAMPSLRKSTVISVRNVRIGIIGYLTPYTKNITGPNNVTFLPEVPSIK